MSNNKQQTAVDVAELSMKLYPFSNSERNAFITGYNKAKEIEKEQIAKAFDDGDYNYHYSRKTGDDFEDGKEYYQEVYG
jgi:hypothetical protein